MKSLGRHALVCLIALFALLALPSIAAAHMGHQRPTIEGRKRAETPREGPRGRARVTIPGGRSVLELARSAEGLSASFELKNIGDGQLEVFSVALEAEDGFPRAPIGIGVHSSGRETKPLAPGESRIYSVTWASNQTLARQLHAYLVIESDGAAPGATVYDPAPVVAVVADRRPFWQRSILSLLVWAPLLLALLALASWRMPSLNVRRLRFAAIAVAGVVALASLIPAAGFVRVLSREDGNWGLQHIERAQLPGQLEYFLAVDGMTVALLPALALVLLAVVLSITDSPAARISIAFGGVATTAAMLFVVSQGMFLSLLALGVFSAAAVVLAGSKGADQVDSVGGFGDARAARRLVAAAFSFGVVAFAWLTHSLSRLAEHGRLFDGAPATLTDLLPEIARSAAHGHAVAQGAPRVLGMQAEQGLIVLAFAAFIPFLGLAPMHRWLSAVIVGSSAPAAALLVAFAAIIGVVGFTRFTLVAFSDQAAFFASGARVVALVTLCWCGLRAAFSSDVRALVAHLASASGGLVLYALSTMTPQGLSASVALTLTRAVALPLLLLALGALVARTGESLLARSGGFAFVAPRLAAVWLVAVLGVACFGGAFFALFMAVVAAVGAAPWSALAFGVGIALLGAGVARALELLSPAIPTWWRDSPRLEPHGGVLPDLRGRELGWAIVLGAMMISFLIAPRFWLGLADATVLDCFRALSPAGPTQVS